MRASIALCTYNGERFLPEQLASCLRQTRRPDELVAADDGSSDGTLALLEAFAREAPFPVRILRPESRPCGVNGNFDRAFSACTGDVIFPSDQDDVWSQRKLERLLAHLEDPKVELVACNAELVDATGAPMGMDMWTAIQFTPERQRQATCGDTVRVLVFGNFVSGMSSAFRATLLARARPIPSEWVFDGWLAFAAAATRSIALEPEKLVSYRQHGKNQIGAPGWSLRSWIERAFKVTRGDLALHGRSLLVARERLSDKLTEDQKALMAERARHYLARGGLSDGVIGRLAPIFAELARGQYHRHSQGLKSAVVDGLGRL